MTVVLLYDQNMILLDQILKKSSTLPICPDFNSPLVGTNFHNKTCLILTNTWYNRPFPGSPGPLNQSEVKCSAFDMGISFILMQITLLFTRKVVHLASF